MVELSHTQFVVPRVVHWQLRTRKLELTRRPLLMGIVNVTPDSFSDGNRFFGLEAAVEHSLRLAAEGADLIDIGGESTRPYSTPVTEEEEMRRVVPVVAELCRQVRIPISIDTSKAAVADAAIAEGAEIINDVTALTGDPRMLEVAARSGAGICLMHMQGNPQTMQDHPHYDDLHGEVHEFLRGRRDAALVAGIAAERIALDPGIGFGKSHQHNLDLLAGCWRLHALRCPLLVGPSRKGFIAKVTCDKQVDRLAGTIGVALALARQGVQILRVHDVLAVRQALDVFVAVGGLEVS